MRKKNLINSSSRAAAFQLLFFFLSSAILLALPVVFKSSAKSLSPGKGSNSSARNTRIEEKGKAHVETSNQFGTPNNIDINQNQDYLFTDGLAIFLRSSGSPTMTRLYQSGEPVPGNPISRGDIITGGIRLNNSSVAVFPVDYPQSNGLFQKSLLRYNGSLQTIFHSTYIAQN